MKNLKKTLSLLLAMLMLVSVFAGCGGKAEGGKAEGPAIEAPADPFAPYEETVKLTSFFEISAPIMNSFKESQLTDYELTLLQYIKEQTNIEIEYLWYAMDSEEDSDTKKNTAIATGDIPDFMVVNSAQLALLAKTDLINKDMGAYIDAYANDTLKSWLNAQNGAPLSAATYGGKVIAVPLPGSSMGSVPVMWIRNDWLQNLNLEVPTTIDELYTVMKAFKDNDPDGNGEADTVGFVTNKAFLGMGLADAIGIFNGFNAYPTYWIEDGQGGLQYGAITEESKQALEFLAKLYAEGIIEEDFSVKDDMGAVEVIASGKTGIAFGANWNYAWPMGMTSMNVPEADWIAVSIPGLEGVGHAQMTMSMNGYAVVSADCAHPEAVVKLINAWVDANINVSREEYASFLLDDDGDGIPTMPQHWVMLKCDSATKELDIYYALKEAIEKDDPSILSAENIVYWDQIKAYEAGDMSQIIGARTYGPENSAMAAIAGYFDAGVVMDNKFTGAQTDTMGKKMSNVTDKVYEYYTKVIMGIETLDSFDAFVKELNDLGLADITAEVNEWYASK